MWQFQYPVIDMLKTGKNLRLQMDSSGMSVRDIQTALGFTAPQSVYCWIRGISMPSLDSLYALSDLLCVPMDDLIIGNRSQQFYKCPYLPDCSMCREKLSHKSIMDVAS